MLKRMAKFTLVTCRFYTKRIDIYGNFILSKSSTMHYVVVSPAGRHNPCFLLYISVILRHSFLTIESKNLS